MWEYAETCRLNMKPQALFIAVAGAPAGTDEVVPETVIMTAVLLEVRLETQEARVLRNCELSL